MTSRHSWLIALAFATLLCESPLASAASCESVAALALPHVAVTLANVVEAGASVPFPAGRGSNAAAAAPGGRGGAPASPFADLPAFCRVTATLTPTPDSEIKMELWMPVAAAEGSGEPRR